MLKMSTELRAGTSWYSSLFFILLYYKGKTVLFSVFLPCLINFSSYLCKQHLYCKPMYHSSVSKKYLLFLSLTLTPSKIRPNHWDSLPFENLAAKCSAPLLLGPSWEQVWWLHVFFRLWSTETRSFFFRRWDSKDGVRGKKEEDERAALMNFVPTEMAFLRPEVSQKDLVSCFLVLVFDSCSGFWKLIVS